MGLLVTAKPFGNLAEKIVALRDAGANIDPKMSAIVRESAFIVTAGAKDLVPVSTGALRRSIQPTFFNGGLSAIIGSWLPYAGKQEYDSTLDHTVRPSRYRLRNTIAGLIGSVIKGTAQTNPNATFGFLRKSLYAEEGNFLSKMTRLVYGVGEAWGR